MLFDHGPAEFPVATVVPHEMSSRALVMVGDARRWLLARWTWLRPRTVPVIAAVFGMLFVLASANYLAHAQGQQQPQQDDVLLIRMR